MPATFDDLKHWVWATNERISTYCLKLNESMNIMPVLGEPDVAQQHTYSSTNSELHALINAANQMLQAASSLNVPSNLIDDSLKEVVRHLRNLLEHWEENQEYFSNSDTEIPVSSNTRSARWFKSHFPASAPWAGGWSNLEGYSVGDALYLGQLHSQLRRLEYYIENQHQG